MSNRRLGLGILIALAFGGAAADTGVPTGLLEGRIVEGETLAPIVGATIVITGRLNGSNGHGTFLLPDGEHKPPCKGQGPLNLDMDVALYRDCTPPDLSKVNTEPVIKRPAQ